MDMRSKCTAHAWHVHGKCIACAWHMHGGTRMAHAKHVHGADVAHAWRMRSMCIEHASHVHGTCMAHATHVHRTCIACAKYMHSMCAANAQHVHCTWMSWNVVLRGCVTTEYTSSIWYFRPSNDSRTCSTSQETKLARATTVQQKLKHALASHAPPTRPRMRRRVRLEWPAIGCSTQGTREASPSDSS